MGIENKIRKIIRDEFNNINEDVVNKNSNTSTRLVEVTYGGKKMNAIAIGYASGPFFKEVYYLIDNKQYENSDFDNVEGIDPSDLIVNG